MKPAFSAVVDDAGALVMDNLREFNTYVALKFTGQRVKVSIEKLGDPQSYDQLKYWWSVPVKLLAGELGYTDAQMHYALLGECFGYTPGPTGQAIPNVSSITDLDREQTTRLIDWVLDWAPSELHIRIPEPDPHWRTNKAKRDAAVSR